MDRFSTQTASLAGNPASHFKFWGELPPSEPVADLKCCDCHNYFSELVDVPGYGKLCTSCAPAAIAFMAEPVEELEAVAAELVSACCGASLRGEYRDYGVCPETGYHDQGEVTICTACGDETEPEMVAAVVRKPVARAMSELMQSEVA